MRLQPPRPSSRSHRIFLAALLALPLSLLLSAQRYDSMSPRELQRRLEQDTNRLIDSLRSQRNSSSPPRSRSSSSGSNAWYDGLAARAQQERESRAAQARLDAEWRRDHPNETRQQYFDRIDREAAAEARVERLAREAAERAQRTREAAERERQETADWARIRASHGGYAAQVRPPLFTTPAASLDWYLLHESSYHNEWAANQAAMLLIEGTGVPQDLVKAARLLDPTSETAKKAGVRHVETRALFAYLQLTHPDAVKAAGLEVNTTAARADLDDAASKNQLAKWYLARVLNTSGSPADQKHALRLITPGAQWARVYFAGQVQEGPAGRDPISKQLRTLALSIVEKQRAHIPATIRELPMIEFETFSDLLPYTSEPLRTEAMTLYVENLVDRVVPHTPEKEFVIYPFDNLLSHAGDAGIDAVYGLAALRRFHLLEIEPRTSFKPSWTHFRDTDRTLAALTRWAARDDVLGIRARLAIQGLAQEAAASQWWTPSKLNEVIDYQDAIVAYQRALQGVAEIPGGKSIFQVRDEAEAAQTPARKKALEAFARRDAAAPKLDAIPDLIASMKIGPQWREELKQLKAPIADAPSDPALFAITHSAFDPDQAAARYEAAFAPGAPEAIRWHNLFQAMRCGDALAPRVLARDLFWELPAPNREKLHKLSEDRLARDIAARRPRALLARAVSVLFSDRENASTALAEAAAAGSVLAPRLLLNERIGATMAREDGRPISWGLDPTLIAEYDAAIASGENTSAFQTEWNVVRGALSADDAERVSRDWFNYVQLWIADREERLADAAFARAVMPQVDAVIATLADWPGLNQDDPLRAEWLSAANAELREARALLRIDDGIGALKAFLAAAGHGDRGALELLAIHIREGDGNLPRSPEIAGKLQTAAFKMTIADAEAGDAFAANYIGECYREGSNGITPDPAQALAWLRYAADLGQASAARTLAQSDAQGLNRTPADLVHWAAVRDACEYNEFLPKPPRRLSVPRIDLTAIRPQLEAAVTALNTFRSKKPVELTSDQEDAEMVRIDAAQAELKANPANGLVLLAQIAASGNRYVAHDIARILSRGDYAVQPEPALAKRFHAAGLALLEREAEYGNIGSAHRLGLYALGMGEKPDIATALRWLTYAAELGNSMAAQLLSQIYTDGLPGLAPDPKQAAHWTAFEEKSADENFKPREPLKK